MAVLNFEAKITCSDMMLTGNDLGPDERARVVTITEISFEIPEKVPEDT